MNTNVAEPPILVAETIPDFLIKEEINGKPYAYKGYKKVLSKEKNLEEIMGCSTLQAILISHLLKLLYRNLDDSKYEILTNEAGLHLKHKSNLSCDIAIYEQALITTSFINKHYASVAPKIVIEVDIDIDIQDAISLLSSDYKYINHKINALFGFGVERVIWVLSETEQVLIATPHKDWIFVDWNKDIEILDSVIFNLGKFIKEKGIEL